jgi:hypothetical protein
MAFSYRAPVRTRSGEWIEVAVPLDRFEATLFGRVLPGMGPVEPRSGTSIGFLLAEKRPGPFMLEVAWINVLRGPHLRMQTKRDEAAGADVWPSDRSTGSASPRAWRGATRPSAPTTCSLPRTHAVPA